MRNPNPAASLWSTSEASGGTSTLKFMPKVATRPTTDTAMSTTGVPRTKRRPSARFSDHVADGLGPRYEARHVELVVAHHRQPDDHREEAHGVDRERDGDPERADREARDRRDRRPARR